MHIIGLLLGGYYAIGVSAAAYMFYNEYTLPGYQPIRASDIEMTKIDFIFYNNTRLDKLFDNMSETKELAEPKPTHYQFIYDEALVREFAEMFVGGIDGEDSVKFMYLSSRRKYADKKGTNHRSTQVMNRKIVNSDSVDRFVRFIRQYEIPLEGYTDEADRPLDADTMVVYFLINPRSMLAAWAKTQMQVTEHWMKLVNGIRSDFHMGRLESSIKSNLHKSMLPNKPYIELDIDTKDEAVVARIRRAIKPFIEYIVCTVETHGGYHVIFQIPKAPRGAMYMAFCKPNWSFMGKNRLGVDLKKDYVDVRPDPSPPIPGTLQAGFRVRMLNGFW